MCFRFLRSGWLQSRFAKVAGAEAVVERTAMNCQILLVAGKQARRWGGKTATAPWGFVLGFPLDFEGHLALELCFLAAF